MLAKKEKVFMKGIKIFLKRKKNKNMVISYIELFLKNKKKKKENMVANEIKILVLTKLKLQLNIKVL